MDLIIIFWKIYSLYSFKFIDFCFDFKKNSSWQKNVHVHMCVHAPTHKHFNFEIGLDV